MNNDNNNKNNSNSNSNSNSNCSIAKEVDLYTIYIGLTDSDSNKQELETEGILRVVSRSCCVYNLNYSCTIQTGGYIKSDGSYTTENSLQLSFIDEDEDKVMELASDICTFLNQESVLITKDRVKKLYVREKLKI